eukprot:scaffold246761_cov55-Prasinocladus_malaysianus.AAC.1
MATRERLRGVARLVRRASSRRAAGCFGPAGAKYCLRLMTCNPRDNKPGQRQRIEHEMLM